MESHFDLLRKIANHLSCRDMVEEFCMLRIFPMAIEWQVTLDSEKPLFGLPRIVLAGRAERKSKFFCFVNHFWFAFGCYSFFLSFS